MLNKQIVNFIRGYVASVKAVVKYGVPGPWRNIAFQDLTPLVLLAGEMTKVIKAELDAGATSLYDIVTNVDESFRDEYETGHSTEASWLAIYRSEIKIGVSQLWLTANHPQQIFNSNLQAEHISDPRSQLKVLLF